MIAFLSGTVQAKSSSALVVNVNGVGYLVSVSAGMLATAIGSPVELHTAMIVRDDGFWLFGFATAEQLSLFDLLRSVTGVGPKLALAIISTLSPEQIANAVVNEDSAPFQSVSGVGAKTAKLISVTLAGKLKASGSASDVQQNLLETLKGLGWSEREAKDAVAKAIADTPSADLAQLVRASLLILGSR